MNCWEVLGVEITNNEKIIKKAYAKKLKKHHPEEDPESFRYVRAAYEQALAYCKYSENEKSATKQEQKTCYLNNEENKIRQEENQQEKVNGRRWLLQVEELYKNFSKRIQVKNWEDLLSQILYLEVDEMPYIRNGIIDFLDKHYYLPYEVWQQLNKTFELKEVKNQDYLGQQRTLTGQSLSHCRNDIPLRYKLLGTLEDVDYDEIISLYYEAYIMFENNHLEGALQILDEIKRKGVEHPDFNILRTRCYIDSYALDEAKQCMVYLEVGPKDYFDKYIWMLEEVNQRSFTTQKGEILLQKYPTSIPLLFKLGDYYTIMRNYIRALACYEVIISCEGRNVRAHEKRINILGFQGRLGDILEAYRYLAKTFPTRIHFKEQVEKYEGILERRRKYQNLNQGGHNKWFARILGKHSTPRAHRRLNLIFLLGILSLASISIFETPLIILSICVGMLAITGVSILRGGKWTNFLVTVLAIVGVIVAIEGPQLAGDGNVVLVIWSIVFWKTLIIWGNL